MLCITESPHQSFISSNFEINRSLVDRNRRDGKTKKRLSRIDHL